MGIVAFGAGGVPARPGALGRVARRCHFLVGVRHEGGDVEARRRPDDARLMAPRGVVGTAVLQARRPALVDETEGIGSCKGNGKVVGDRHVVTVRTDFVDAATMIRKEKLSDLAVNVKNQTSVCVILFSGGYPAQYDSGYVIRGLDSFTSEKDVFLFHNNTAFRDSDIVTSGGRVLGITALGSNLKEAKESLYSKLKDVSFDGMGYLKNIESS